MFGQPKFSFGSGFGSSPTTTSSGLFGSSTGTGGFVFNSTPSSQSAFGSSPGFGKVTGAISTASPFRTNLSSPFSLGTASTATSGTTIKFEPVIGSDTVKKGSVSSKINTKFICISAMKQYENKSLEELRSEDYAANRKTPTATNFFGTSSSSFPTPFSSAVSSAPGGSLFGSTPFSAATTTQSSFFFGKQADTAASSSPFSFSQNKPFTSNAFSFGTPASTSSTGFVFGSTTTTTSSAFGQTGTGLFSKPIGLGSPLGSFQFSPTTTTQSFLGGSTVTTQSGGLFSSALKPGFLGASTTPPSLFSKPFGSMTSQGTGFGTSLSGGLFGQPASTSSGFTFGSAATTSSALPSFSFLTTTTSSTPGITSMFTAQGANVGQPSLPLSNDADLKNHITQLIFASSVHPYGNHPIFRNYMLPEPKQEKLPVMPANSFSTKKFPEAPKRKESWISKTVRSLYVPIEEDYPPSSLVLHNTAQNIKRLMLNRKGSEVKNEAKNEMSFSTYLKERLKKAHDEAAEKPESSSPSKTACILTKAGYGTIPRLENLTVDDAGNCIVEDFAIFRREYGSIYWPGATNVAGLNLDDIVHIMKMHVVVYPNDDEKPPIGEGLNKVAEITLHNVFPIDKTTREPITVPERIRAVKFEEHLKNLTAKQGATFVDYDADIGSWIFSVDHFSKYGIEEGDAEDIEVDSPEIDVVQEVETSPVEQSTAADEQYPCAFSAESTNDFSTNKVQRYDFENVDVSDIHELERSNHKFSLSNFFRNDSNSSLIDKAALARSIEKSRNKITALARNLGNNTSEDEVMHEYCPISEDKSVERTHYVSRLTDLESSVISESRNNAGLFKQIPVPWNESYFCTEKALLTERAFCISRSFRTNFITSFCYIPCNDNYSVLSQKQAPTASITAEDYATLMQCLQFQYDRTDVTLTSNELPFYHPKRSSDLLSAFCDEFKKKKHESHFYRYLRQTSNLCMCLWDDSQDGHNAYTNEKYRKTKLIEWLQELYVESNDYAVDVSSTPKNLDMLYRDIFHLLLTGDIFSAVELAIANKHYRLAALMAASCGDLTTQQLINAQLTHWVDMDVTDNINVNLLKIYIMLSGQLFTEDSNQKYISIVDDRCWFESLLIILKYSCASHVPVAQCLAVYEALCEDGHCKFAFVGHPSYQDDSTDLRYMLIRLFCTELSQLSGILFPESWTSDSMDYKLSWCVLLFIRSLNVKLVDTCLNDRTCINFAYQLENYKLWHWSVFVLLHIKDMHSREEAVTSVVYRNVVESNKPSDEEQWIFDNLSLSKLLIWKAKGMKAMRLKMWPCAFQNFINAGLYEDGFNVLLRNVMPSAFLKNDFSSIKDLFKVYDGKVTGDQALFKWSNCAQFLHLFFTVDHMFKTMVISSDERFHKAAYELIDHMTPMVPLLPHLSEFPNFPRFIALRIADRLNDMLQILSKWLIESAYVCTLKENKVITSFNLCNELVSIKKVF